MGRDDRNRPEAPAPGRLWTPPRQFARLDRRLLFEGKIGRVTPETLAFYVFLCLAADERGVSWWGQDRIARLTGLDWRALDEAIDRLRELDWIVFEPRQRSCDGIYQVLDLPKEER